MIQAILFDLDDTLLGNSMKAFIPRYFDLFGKHAGQYLEKKRFLAELLYCTQAMMANTDPALSNRDAFWSAFEERTGLRTAELEPFFDQFYRGHFSQLQAVTQQRPVAAELIRACFARGLQVVIATNPVFPLVAIEQRLLWAGVPVTEFDYALVTSHENMYATKPHQAYYRQILRTIDCSPELALMIGDNWENDIEPAAKLGLNTYWVAPDGTVPPDVNLVSEYGTLDKLYQLVSSGWLDTLED
ncbi:MAG TPA: HAD family hydrolase [Anaerolineae bacterium]